MGRIRIRTRSWRCCPPRCRHILCFQVSPGSPRCCRPLLRQEERRCRCLLRLRIRCWNPEQQCLLRIPRQPLRQRSARTLFRCRDQGQEVRVRLRLRLIPTTAMDTDTDVPTVTDMAMDTDTMVVTTVMDTVMATATATTVKLELSC